MATVTMRALVCTKLGDGKLPMSDEKSPIAVLEWPRPKLTTPTSVSVRVIAISVNFNVLLMMGGTYQEKLTLPFIPGGDYSGVVTEVGEKVANFKVGDSICGQSLSGAFAEEVVEEENNLYKLPSGCDVATAGGIPVVFGTSHVALVNRANVKDGQVVLVLGAAGGTGLAAVQIAKLYGAVVIAVARGKEKAELLNSYGADFVVDPSEGVIKPVQAFLKSQKLPGVDILYDPVGGPLLKESLKLLKWGGQVLIIGFAGGEVFSIPSNLALVKNWTIHGLYWGSYAQHQPQELRDSMKQLLAWFAEGKLKVHVYKKFSLSESNLAFSAIADRKVLGKVLVTFGDQPQSRL